MTKTIISILVFLVYSTTGLAGPMLSAAMGKPGYTTEKGTSQVPQQENQELSEESEEDFCHRCAFPQHCILEQSSPSIYGVTRACLLQVVFDEIQTPPPKLI